MPLRISLLLASLFFAIVSCKNKTAQTDEDNDNGSYSGATEITEISEEIDDNPNNASLYLRRAELYDRKGDLEPAIRDAEKAATLDSTRASNHVFLARLYEKREYMKGAIQAYEKAAKLNPKDKNTFLKLGTLYFQVQDRNNSFKNLNAAISLDPNSAEAFYYRGYNYRELNEPDKAIREFQMARELKNDYTDAYMQLGLLYADKKDRRAGEYYTTALRLDPGNLKALYARGIYYQEVDSTQLAIRDYEHILEVTPEFLSTNLNLGYIYLLKKDYDKAVTYFTAAVDNNPSLKEAYEYRSQAYKALGKKDLAAADAEKVKELKNKPPVE